MKTEYYPVIGDMIGRTFTSVTATDDELIFKGDEGTFTFYHEQDCCENVSIESIVGDLNDLVGEPLLRAEEESSEAEQPTDPDNYWDDSATWTFYKFATRKGYVDVRWLGQSNGYYSERVDLAFTKDEQ